MVRKIGKLFKIFKILIVPLFWLTFDDVTVTLPSVVLSGIFVTNSALYFLTPYQNLLRLNVIFMVRKIGQLLPNGGWAWLPPPSTLPLSNFRAKTVGPIRKMFSWTDVPRMSLQLKISLQKKLFPFSRKKWKPVGGWHPPPPPWPSEG